MKNIALILASGVGSRCGQGYPKQFIKINNKTILEHTIDRFHNNINIDEIYIVTHPDYVEKLQNLLNKYNKVKKVIAGGKTRTDSSYNGIYSIPYDECNVLIHDGVRPLVSDEIINNCLNTLELKKAVCVSIDSTDTIYVIKEDGEICDVPKRSTLKRAQTPQCFKLSLIKKAHALAKQDKNCTVTDDCGLIMHYKLDKVYITEGSEENIKITYPEDIEFAKNKLC